MFKHHNAVPEGAEYKISVIITDIENPPVDGSSLKYLLVEILE